MATHIDAVSEADEQETPLRFPVSPEVADSPQCVVPAAPSRVFKVLTATEELYIMQYVLCSIVYYVCSSNTFVELQLQYCVLFCAIRLFSLVTQELARRP